MRRLVLLLLVLILPLQLAWAGAATYCQHESRHEGQNGGVAHIGHHDHQHRADGNSIAADEKDKSTTDNKAALDQDCGICQLASVPFALAGQPPVVATACPQAAPRTVEKVFDSFSARAPDRPQWRRLA